MNTVTMSAADLDNLDSKLAAASACVDALFTLTATGDVESLCKGTLPTLLGEAHERIEEVRAQLHKTAQGDKK